LKTTRIILGLLFINLVGYSQTYQGSIIRVIDGDTYVFQTEEGSFVVRMQGIDAPERDQPYSKESASFLEKYLNWEAIVIKTGMDRYGRTLGTLIIDSIDINMLSIKNGCTWHFKKYSKDQDYANAELYASSNKIGLWSLDNQVPPWEWRKKDMLEKNKFD
jgi:micrococcal nuclease